MISQEEITQIGYFNQPHGIKGELNAVITAEVDLEALSCIILDMDGIYVPFFIEGIRQRGSLSYLLTIDGIDGELKAASLSNKSIYALRDEVIEFSESGDAEGFYADDLIGYEIKSAEGMSIGTITDIDDATENVLFVVETPQEKTVLIPVADELITDIDPDARVVTVTLPDGLLDL